MLSPKCEIGNIVCKYPGNCTKCRINEILFCKVCSRRMGSANFYNQHIAGKQHIKMEKRSGLPPSQPLLEGDSNFYAVWPPVAIDCSSPIPERAHRHSATPSLDLVKIMDQFSKCNVCRSTIAFNKYCWEIQPCKHKMHEECFKKLSDYRGQITCLYCLHQR